MNRVPTYAQLEQEIFSLKNQVAFYKAELENELQRKEHGVLTPRADAVLDLAVEQGVKLGVRHAYKHTDATPPTDDQIDTIIGDVVNQVLEWFSV